MRALAVLVYLFVVGCANEKGTIENSIFAEGKVMGELATEINEASGLACSMMNPGFLWTHNDSGDVARIFLLDSAGNTVWRVYIEGIRNRDWEDIAVGPGPDSTKQYIYIGEIGDNQAIYPYKYIYRMEEPVYPGTPTDTIITAVDSIRFVYPDGNRDAETVLVDPRTRNLYIISKREERVNLYRLAFPQNITTITTAEKLAAELMFTQKSDPLGFHRDYYKQVVAGDISPDGKEVLIKTYSTVFYWKDQNGLTIDSLLKTAPALLPYTPEPRGEAIAFDYYGNGYYTLSEEVEGITPRLIFYERKK